MEQAQRGHAQSWPDGIVADVLSVPDLEGVGSQEESRQQADPPVDHRSTRLMAEGDGEDSEKQAQESSDELTLAQRGCPVV